MNEYELMLLLDPELDEAARAELVGRVTEIAKKNGGSWVSDLDWGRRKLTYEILKKREAHYHLCNVDCTGDNLDEITRTLRITDGVMRVLAVRRVPESPAEVEKVAVATREDRSERPRGRGGPRRER